MTPLERVLERLPSAQRCGGGYIARCPAHDDSRPSLSVGEGRDGRALVNCLAGVGCTFDAIVAAMELRQRDLFPGAAGDDRRRGDDRWRQSAPSARPTGPRPAAEPGARDGVRDVVERILRAAQRDDGRIAAYLRSRGLSGVVPASLRFAPSLAYVEEGRPTRRLPAMVSAVRATDGRVIGVHRTFLDRLSAGKALVVSPKKSLGPVRGGAVRLAPVGAALALTEGIETGLAVLEATGMATWAAISAPGLAAIKLPAEVRAVAIWSDNDVSDAGQRAADSLAARLRREGRRVRVLLPRDVGQDWLDVLVAAGPEALRAAHEGVAR